MAGAVPITRIVQEEEPFPICPHSEMIVERGSMSMRRQAALTSQDIWADQLRLAPAQQGEET
jgi:hypothetical protein